MENPMNEIIKDKQLRSNFLITFKNLLEQLGEKIIQPFSDKRILEVFRDRGYWAGNKYRIIFEGDSFTYEERKFGK